MIIKIAHGLRGWIKLPILCKLSISKPRESFNSPFLLGYLPGYRTKRIQNNLLYIKNFPISWCENPTADQWTLIMACVSLYHIARTMSTHKILAIGPFSPLFIWMSHNSHLNKKFLGFPYNNLLYIIVYAWEGRVWLSWKSCILSFSTLLSWIIFFRAVVLLTHSQKCFFVTEISFMSSNIRKRPGPEKWTC